VRILFLCHRIPYPPNKGEKIRAFHELRALAERHEVDLYTLADDPGDLSYEAALRPYCRQVRVARLNPKLTRLLALPYLLTEKPLTIPYFHSGALAREARMAVSTRSYDRIFVYCSAMAQYVDWTWGIPVIVDLVDVDSDKWTQYAAAASFPGSFIYRREGRRLRQYERDLCDRAAAVLVTTQREAGLVRQISGNASVFAVPNGVDAAYFNPGLVPPARPSAPTIIFTGDMSYFPNQEAVEFFVRNVLPRIQQRLEGVRFLIVGRNPGERVLKLRSSPGVEVTGFVPDVRPYLAQAQVAVAPFSIAAGIPNKVLEAMAYGLPVVATSRVLQGLSASLGIQVADDPVEMANAVCQLLMDPELACQRGISGREQVVKQHDWTRMLARICDLVENPTTASLQEQYSRA
jgi:polysaccharide biosynthesis protein PslH